MSIKSVMRILACSIVALMTASGASAQSSYPSKPVEFVIGYAPGGGVDAYGRALAAAIRPALNGHPSVVINRDGAGSTIALSYVKERPADGHTISVTSSGSLLLRSLFGDHSYDLQNDFVPVAMIGDLISALFVRHDSPYETVDDLLKALKAKSERTLWAHNGRQATYHVAGTALVNAYELNVRDVPFQSTGAARNALINGEVEFVVLGLGHWAGFEEQLRPLGVFADERDSTAPDVPTLAEQGIDVPSVSTPQIIFVRAGTPAEIVDYLTDAVADAVQTEIFADLTAKARLPILYRDPAATSAWLDEATTEWKPVVEAIRGEAAR